MTPLHHSTAFITCPAIFPTCCRSGWLGNDLLGDRLQALSSPAASVLDSVAVTLTPCDSPNVVVNLAPTFPGWGSIAPHETSDLSAANTLLIEPSVAMGGHRPRPRTWRLT